MTIVVPVRIRGAPNTIAPSLEKRCLDIAIEAEIAVVKDEDMLDATKAVDSSRRSREMATTQQLFLPETKTVSCVNSEIF